MNNLITSHTGNLFGDYAKAFCHRLVNPEDPVFFVNESDQVRHRINQPYSPHAGFPVQHHLGAVLVELDAFDL